MKNVLLLNFLKISRDESCHELFKFHTRQVISYLINNLRLTLTFCTQIQRFKLRVGYMIMNSQSTMEKLMAIQLNPQLLLLD